MGAEVAVSILLVKLQKLLVDERVMLPGLSNRVQTAVNELKQILRFLEAANPNQDNASSTQLEARILRIIYPTDYITESFLLKRVQRRPPTGVNKIIEIPLMAFPTQSQLQFICKMKQLVKSMRAISSEFAKMHDLVHKTKLEERYKFRGHQYDQSPGVLVGRGDDEKHLVDRLIDHNEESLRVISLVSEESLGKTALARNVYNRLDIRQHFQYRAWLHVPKEYTYKDLLLIIIKQIPIHGLKDVELMNEDSLLALLFQILMQVRFLVVLDDVRTVDDWHRLFYSFADSQNGSRIILTTRDSNVAALADPWSCSLNLNLNLRRLNDNESWELFYKKVPRLEISSENTDSNNLRAEILRRCCGLPSAIVLLAGMFSTIELSEWSSVIDLLHSQDQSTLLDIAALSYHKLPSVLKPCFLYLTLFPKEYEIPVRRLLQLWLAEGFIQTSSEASDVPEDVAKIYFEELVSRNMIEIARWKFDGSPKTCRLPCFLYDVFFPKAEDTGFLHVHHCKTDYTCSPEFRIQRLIDQYSGVKSTSEYHIQYLCSYVSFEAQKRDTFNREIGFFLKTIVNRRGFIRLKVLDLEGIYKPSLHEKLGELQNLRYISLRWTALGSCPASIGDLPCLETLDLKYTNITTLPSSIWKAKNLRHLYMNEVSIEKPSNACSTNLQTLMGLLIGSMNPKKYGLDRCTGLRKLRLTCHKNSVNDTVNCISQLGNLQSLKLSSRDPFGQALDLELSLMKGHQSLSNLHLFGMMKDCEINNLPGNLQSLTLAMTKLMKDPMLVLGELPQLIKLRLLAGSYAGLEMSCLDGHFPKLRVLKLWKLEQVKQWTVQEGSMPQLLELEIRSCKELKTLDGLQMLPALKEVILTNMPKDFVSDVKNVRKRFGKYILLTNEWQCSQQSCKLFLLFIYILNPTRNFIVVQNYFSYFYDSMILRLSFVYEIKSHEIHQILKRPK